jgi:hypothetical protein
MTFKAAQTMHLTALAALGWTVAAHLKVPHATRADGLRLWFKPQAVHASIGSERGEALSTWLDPRKATTAQLVAQGERIATLAR